MAFSRSLLNFFVPLWGLLQLIYLFGDGSGNYAVYRSTVLLLSGNYSLADLRNISLHKWNLLVSQTEKAMAPHSSTLAWRIPGTGESGGLPSMGLHRVRHDWSDLAAVSQSKLKCTSMTTFKALFLIVYYLRTHPHPLKILNTSAFPSWTLHLRAVFQIVHPARK